MQLDYEENLNCFINRLKVMVDNAGAPKNIVFTSNIIVSEKSDPTLPSHFQGSARRLVKAALLEAAKKREMRYSDLKKIDRGVRRHFHDDITVIVVFLDSNLVSRASSTRGPTLSVRGGGINLPAKTLAPMELNAT